MSSHSNVVAGQFIQGVVGSVSGCDWPNRIPEMVGTHAQLYLHRFVCNGWVYGASCYGVIFPCRAKGQRGNGTVPAKRGFLFGVKRRRRKSGRRTGVVSPEARLRGGCCLLDTEVTLFVINKKGRPVHLLASCPHKHVSSTSTGSGRSWHSQRGHAFS